MSFNIVTMLIDRDYARIFLLCNATALISVGGIKGRHWKGRRQKEDVRKDFAFVFCRSELLPMIYWIISTKTFI